MKIYNFLSWLMTCLKNTIGEIEHFIMVTLSTPGGIYEPNGSFLRLILAGLYTILVLAIWILILPIVYIIGQTMLIYCIMNLFVEIEDRINSR